MQPVSISPSRSRVRSARLALALLLVGVTCAACRSSAAPSPGAGPTPGHAVAAADATPPQGNDVAQLASPDFVLRSRAAERLLARGPSVLGELGAAGEMPVAALGGGRDSATSSVVAAILARMPDPEVEPLLASPHPTLRRAAALELGQRSAWAPVPALIEGLDDTDPRARAAAHAALKRLTGELSDPPGSGSRRDRWRTWWTQEGRLKAEGRQPPTAG